MRFSVNKDEIALGAVGRMRDLGLVHAPAALLSPESLQVKRLLDVAVVTITLPVWGAIMLAYASFKALRPGQLILITDDRVGRGEAASR